MPDEKRFLIGNGDNLREPISPPPRNPIKAHPYTIDDAKRRLQPRLEHTVETLTKLSTAACPKNEATALLTLHPTYIAKSYFPSQLLRAIGLRTLGSRSRIIKPEKVTTKKPPIPVSTVEIYVSGERQRFVNWAKSMKRWNKSTFSAIDEIVEVEDIRPLTPELRLKSVPPDNPSPLLEFVVHNGHAAYVLNGLEEFLKEFKLKLDINNSFHVRGLSFFSLRVPQGLINTVAEFSFLRVARPMPVLRRIPPIIVPIRQTGPKFKVILPSGDVMNPEVQAAVFDGGLPQKQSLQKWVASYEDSGLSKSIPEYEDHGLAVTSALLFGSIENGKELSVPPGRVDHYRVLDDITGRNGNNELYDVLRRIDDVLKTKKYEFVNLSIGPSLPIEDDDVHAWTAVLDEHLSRGQTLATIAVGNDGELDRASGNARIQVPSDCVNGLAVGACDSQEDPWQRASYSSIGPGRCPGIIKPDVVAFGGVSGNPFHVIVRGDDPVAVGTSGTSFASPLVLGKAMEIRAYMGPQISPLALKALLINRAETNEEHISEVGWGRVPSDTESLLLCKEGEVRIVYQGLLGPAMYVRLPVPLPKGPIKGKVAITATFCFASGIDPEDPVNYTRSSLDIVFRPDRLRFQDKKQSTPNSKTFFGKDKYATEHELRSSLHKWETVRHDKVSMLGSSLNDPVFDVHHGVRYRGGLIQTHNADTIPYALVINIEAKKVPNIYNEVLTRYPAKLQALVPVIRVPIRAIAQK
jgi:hypothetical protein